MMDAHKDRRRAGAVALLFTLIVAGFIIFATLHKVDREPKATLRLRAYMHGYTYLDSNQVVFQRGRFDCGPAALRMMLLQLGKDIPLDSLEHRALDTPTGTSVGRMVQILIAQGVPTHAAKLPLGEWKRLPPPYISLYDGNHFLLVASKVGDGYEILDPALGRGLISAAKLYHLSQGIVIAPNGFQAS